MAHFAQIKNSVVQRVIVAEQAFIDSGAVGDPSLWVQTSYNTRGGVHYGQEGKPDGGIALRKNYAGIGYTYDLTRDAFIPPRPFPSWTLDGGTCLWNPLVSKPVGDYLWNENTKNWVVEVIKL